MARFDQKLVLSRWMLEQFGAKDFARLQAVLADAELGFDVENTSLFYYELAEKLPANRNIDNDTLRLYDENIVRHWKMITGKRNRVGNTLYPLYFQYLAMMFTEHYLDRYFRDSTSLCAALNTFRENFNKNLPEREQIEPFVEKDLNKLGVWIATGGGKTLIMHVNILQFHHYRKKHRKDASFNRTILLTPNEGLSDQHLQEAHLSGLDGAHKFQDSRQLPLSGSTGPIDIIDIHKLKDKKGQDKKGQKTFAVESFEANNLVLVDEGHRGASGDEWLSKRNQLCEEGFSFEYSATFGQAIKAASGSDAPTPRGRAKSKKYQLIQQYAKCIMFDYSYKFFHEDGYGKDHLILNLSEEKLAEQRQLYLTACLLAFFQQKLVYQEKRKDIVPYLISDPLWIFVGGKVTAKNEANPETVGDIQAIIYFIARFLANQNGETISFLHQLLNQQDDLRDSAGRLIFDKAFLYVQSRYSTEQAEKLFQDVLAQVFHAQAAGDLHIIHLKGSGGEIGLRVGDHDWFGLINVGDSAKLIKLCEKTSADNVIVADQTFSDSLFHAINHKDSSINVLIGAKKFTEGWSSWRVSTMGLMNVGRSEGSEIIQLFGRGVRLKGYDFTLKRSKHIHGINHPDFLPILETLNVFGIRSDYMKEFEEYLEEEGIGEPESEEVILPVIKQPGRHDLKLIRIKKGLPDFKKARNPWLEMPPKLMKSRIVLDWYPKIQAKRSSGVSSAGKAVDLKEGVLDDRHLAFLNFEAIYFELVQYKKEKAWYNLQLNREIIRRLLENPGWYTLYIPPELLEVSDFKRVFIWQEIAIALLKKYCERYYAFRKNEYESPHLEYYDVRDSDDNVIDQYTATIRRSEQEWIDKINELKEKLENRTFREKWSFGNLKAIGFARHLYQPLICFKNNETLKISPVPLNAGEQGFVEDLKAYYATSPATLAGKELFLLRNQSKGKGVGFFEAGNFYPDFILWIIADGRQYVAFIDPKGLTRIHGFDDPKIKFCKKVKEIQKQLGDPDVVLNSYIVSNTDRRDIEWWAGGEDTEQAFSGNHVLFQKEDKNTYIDGIISSMLA